MSIMCERESCYMEMQLIYCDENGMRLPLFDGYAVKCVNVKDVKVIKMSQRVGR